MPKKRLVLVLVDVDRERWDANALVQGVTLERFVREAVEHRIRCRAPSST